MYPHLFLAGTFDGLHAGHRAILTRAFTEGERVTIGLTSDAFVSKVKSRKSKVKINTFEERKRILGRWLENQKKRATIIPIDDPYEPAAGMKDLDALIVTAENRKTGERINALRYALGVSPLVLIEVPMVEAEDGKPVSSTRMRNGEIDHNGNLIMPEFLRSALKKPLGNILKKWKPVEIQSIIITVGDIATKTFLDAGIIPKLAIIDGMVGRKPFHKTLKMLQPQKVKPFRFKGVKSGPGYISREAVKVIQDCFTHPSSLIPHHAIIIDGEEDLLVLPAILHAPLGSILYYGQPGEGLVEVVVTEKKKQQVLALLGKFT